MKKMRRDPVEVVVTADILALDKVMTYLNVRDLLSCRLVSDLWNRSASMELRLRSTKIRTTKLVELGDCMSQSWNFPFAGLELARSCDFQCDAAMDFFLKHGARFTRLSVSTCRLERMHDLAPIINHLPYLSTLELGQLYGPSFDKLPFTAAGKTNHVLQLPKLQTIRISDSIPGHCEEILGQVLKAAASPSLQIELLNATPGMLAVVKSAGKLGAVSVMKFDSAIDCSYKSEMDQLLSTGSPSLTKLNFHSRGSLSKYGLKKVLFSSQRSLKELHLRGICISQISIYKRIAFTRLTKLSYDFHVHSHTEYLFKGRHEGNFPALKKLKLKIRYTVREPRQVVLLDDLVIPSVTSLDLDGCVCEGVLKKFAQMFPNVIEMRLDSGGYYSYSGRRSYGSNSCDVWNAREFKCLKKLRIWNFMVGNPTQMNLTMDSFLTGIPLEECQQLNLNKIPFKETLRVTPTILELETLQKLVVCVKFEKKCTQLTEHAPFISMASVLYALGMMPTLQAEFVYEPLLHKEQDREVLEAAFKNVQEYVPLKRFYY